MKNVVTLIGIGLTLLGLILMARGVAEMVNIGCDADFGDCSTNTGDLVFSFAIGIALLTIGPIIWNAGAAAVRSGPRPNILGSIGYLGIFGLSFGGVGLIMLYQAAQPGSEDPGGVLIILGICFGLVGLGSLLVEVLFHISERNVAKLRQTGLHGRGIVTGVHDTGITVNLDPVVKFDLRVELPGVTPYMTTARHTVPRLSVGSLVAGLVVPVLADPAHPDQITVDWDSPTALSIAADADGTDPAGGAGAVAGAPIALGGGVTSLVSGAGGTHRRGTAGSGGAASVLGTAGVTSLTGSGGGVGTGSGSASGSGVPASMSPAAEAAALTSAAAALNQAAAAAEAREAAGAAGGVGYGAGAAAGSGGAVDLGTTVNVQGGALSPELLRTVSQALTAAAASGQLTDMPVMTIDARGAVHAGDGAPIGAGTSAAAPTGIGTPAPTGAGASGQTGAADRLPARVQIDAMQDTGVDMGGARLYAFDLTVSISGRQPYPTKYAGSVPTNLIPRLAKGASFPAIVDPSQPSGLIIQWDR